MKIKQKVFCSICKKLRIVHSFPKTRAEAKEIRAEINKGYVCSDCN